MNIEENVVNKKEWVSYEKTIFSVIGKKKFDLYVLNGFKETVGES